MLKDESQKYTVTTVLTVYTQMYLLFKYKVKIALSMKISENIRHFSHRVLHKRMIFKLPGIQTRSLDVFFLTKAVMSV